MHDHGSVSSIACTVVGAQRWNHDIFGCVSLKLCPDLHAPLCIHGNGNVETLILKRLDRVTVLVQGSVLAAGMVYGTLTIKGRVASQGTRNSHKAGYKAGSASER